jgi:hypothetical protein
LDFSVSKIRLAEDYLALLKFTREELVPALENVHKIAIKYGDGGERSAIFAAIHVRTTGALSRAREMGV